MKVRSTGFGWSLSQSVKFPRANWHSPLQCLSLTPRYHGGCCFLNDGHSEQTMELLIHQTEVRRCLTITKLESAGLPACLIGRCCSCFCGLSLFLCSLASRFCFVWIKVAPPSPPSNYSFGMHSIGCSSTHLLLKLLLIYGSVFVSSSLMLPPSVHVNLPWGNLSPLSPSMQRSAVKPEAHT